VTYTSQQRHLLTEQIYYIYGAEEEKTVTTNGWFPLSRKRRTQTHARPCVLKECE